jgi:hypothetical protein
LRFWVQRRFGVFHRLLLVERKLVFIPVRSGPSWNIDERLLLRVMLGVLRFVAIALVLEVDGCDLVVGHALHPPLPSRSRI